jgi:hypothetical protein
VSRADWGRVLAVTVIVWPFAVCALYAIRQGGRALTNHIRRTR